MKANGDEVDLCQTLEDQGLQRTANKFLRESVIDLEVGSTAWWRAVGLVQRACLEQTRRRRARYEGDHSENHFDELFRDLSGYAVQGSSTQPTSITLDELIRRYQSAPERQHLRPKTLMTYGAIFRLVKEVLGAQTEIRAITRDDCRKLVPVLQHLPPNSTKRFAHLTLLEAAEKAREEGLQH